jgi:hypothetical protein
MRPWILTVLVLSSILLGAVLGHHLDTVRGILVP